MTTANCPGNEELDFRLIFGEDGQQPQLGPADLETDENTSFYILNVGQPPSVVHQSHSHQRHGGPPPAQLIATSPSLQAHHKAYEPSYEHQDSKYTPTGVGGGGNGPPKAFECPSIQITSISPSCQQEMETNEDEMRAKGPDGDYHDRPLSRDHLYLPLDHSYRDSSLSPSPCSSLSSRSWFSDASSCESISHVYDDVDSELNEAAARFTLGSPLTSPGCSPQAGPQEEVWQQQHHQHHPAFTHSLSHSHGHSLSPRQSPCHSPRTSVTDENWLSPRSPSRPSSRPTSPCGKRRHSSADICYLGSLSPHHSPTATPGPSPRGSVTEDTWIGSPSMGMSPFQCCPSEADIPSKTRKTSQDCTTAIQSGKGDLGMDDSGNVSPLLDSTADEAMHGLKKDGSGEQFLSVPSHFTWNKPKPGHTPIFRASSLPPLDWPLPNQYGQYELKIEVHPKAHHRAHYETEGSRGAIKAASGGHPIVKLVGYNEKPVNLQMFIGTADDRYLRPHAFYQVHRITGKTVATASQEIIIASTKVLEIPLLPENNMSASIDCAGILKLRNSDIELRKGETDIGRKNTRVRVVFRVHIPQPSGKVVSLQAASIPVECSQRSAQELPQVEKASISSCPVSGGEEMVITGSNFFPESKVIFLEKGPDGRPQWEVEGKIIREKSQGSSIVVEVPPYHSKTVTSAVQVQFYVCNGKRKRSQSQRFTYLPVRVKQEHRDDLDSPAVPPMSMPLVHAASLVCAQPLSSPEHSHPPDGLLSSSPRGLAAGLHPLQAPCAPIGSPTLPHLPHLQAQGLNAPPECQMPFHPGPAATARPSYPPIQHNMPFNGQHSLPMTAGSPQAYERMPFQADPAGCHTLGLGMVYGPASSTPTSGVPPGPGSSPSHAACTGSNQVMAHSAPHLHSLGYHCPTPGQVPSPTHTLGQPPPQLQRPLVYHPAGQRSASCPTPSSAPAHMVPSPHSGPSSPQLHSLPYHSPTSPSPTSNSPLGPMALSGQPSPQASSPVLAGLSPSGPLVHPLTQQGERLSIKQEPVDREPTFRTIGLQDITLDDVNEIIGRDMSQAPEAHGGSPAAHSQS
ncbi:nuclear factor of activated T- cytoplasmic 3-like isoform X1 [Labeo rohita]|uniref:Nuclear factor of activated T-cytoplasmic 3-like isoform X1 n=2 Tax=Labeonini TaxID=2743697 RepID=A0A498MN83_LABRO|nr:nuclear factor of activated T-cells, cytoplasmic 3 isoform X1 [Labeo rohita]RXN21072.1 nuclear factor of activated T- cytoplasmic 3-like isoform X1 [Labeo rohita]